MAPAAPPGPPPPNRTRTILSRPASRNNRRSRPSAAPSRRRNSSRCRDRTYGCGGAHPLWSCRSGSSAPCTGSVLAGTNARSRRPPCGTAPTATRPTGCWYSTSAQNRACRRKRACQGCRYRRRTPGDGVQSAARDTPRHADKAAALREWVDHRGLLRDADRIVRRQDIANDTDIDPLGDRCPIRLDRAGRGRHLIAFQPDMMLNRADTPQAHVVGGAHDVGRSMDRVLIELTVAADRAKRGAFRVVPGGTSRATPYWHLEIR